jgi:hypothetical protein
MSSLPISPVCPSCGAAEFRKVKAMRGMAFTDDRVCEACGTRYAPPTPGWAGAVFLLFGIILVATGAAVSLSSLAYMFNEKKPGIFGFGIGGLGIGLALAGVAAGVHGCRALLFPGSV